jgi:hypothetical protein
MLTGCVPTLDLVEHVVTGTVKRVAQFLFHSRHFVPHWIVRRSGGPFGENWAERDHLELCTGLRVDFRLAQVTSQRVCSRIAPQMLTETIEW